MKAAVRILAALVMLCTNAYANEAQVAKIGILDWQKIFAKSVPAETAMKRLEKEFQPKKDKLDSLQKELQTRQEKYQRDRSTMNEKTMTTEEREITRLQNEYRRVEEEINGDYGVRYREEIDQLMKVVREVVDKIAAEKGFNLILPMDVTLSVGKGLEITDTVLEQLAQKKK